MPSGINDFRRRQAQKTAQKASYDASNDIRPNYFGIKDMQMAVVRFLEQGDEITWTDYHRVPIEGQQYPVDFVCLDAHDNGTPCPGCQSADAEIKKRSTKGLFNLIWREGPVYKLSDKGWPEKDKITKQKTLIGREDGIFLWKCSWTVVEMLVEKDQKYKGLMSRDWEIKRTGSQLNDTKYFIETAEADSGPQPMLLPDLALAGNKYDLKELIRPMGFDDFAKVLASGSFANGPQPTMDRSAAVPTAANTFDQGGEPVRASAFARG